MKSKTFRSPISMCTLQRVTMKTLLPYKLKVSTQTVTKDFVTLCPEYEVFEKIKKGIIKETIKVNNDKRDRVRTFKKIMLKSASDTMVLNMIMKNKKFSNYVKQSKNQRKENLKSSSSIVLHHKLNIPIKSKIKDSTFITNLKYIQKSENSESSLMARALTTNRIPNYNDLSDLKINKYLRAKKKFNGYIKSSRSQSSQKPLTTSRLNGNGRTIGKIEMLFQPTLGKLDDLRYLIRKDIRRENKNTEREVRHQRILNEMRDIENCIDYKEDKKWYP